jgi:hypothetical protein
MTEQNLIPIKIDQIYIVQEDSNIFATLKNNPKNDASLKIKSRLNDEINSLQLFSDDLRFLNGVSYLNLETFNIIDKHLKENQKLKSDGKIYKKLNKERLATIFKCLGFNIIYCLTIAENIFSVLGILINLKYEEFDKTDYIKTSVLVKQNTFYQIAKNVIKDLTGKKCRIRKYFNLSYLIVSKSYINKKFRQTDPDHNINRRHFRNRKVNSLIIFSKSIRDFDSSINGHNQTHNEKFLLKRRMRSSLFFYI